VLEGPSETSITTILKLAAGDDVSIRVLNFAITLAEQDVNTMLTIVKVG
jgi:chorismate-pyruvate lyase